MRTFGHAYGPPACRVPRDRTTGVSVLLATDFDGTISLVVQDPDAAELHPAARSFLSGVDGPVAILTGRDVKPGDVVLGLASSGVQSTSTFTFMLALSCGSPFPAHLSMV